MISPCYQTHSSGWVHVVAVTVMIKLALFVCVLELLVVFFKICNLSGQLHVAIVLLAWQISGKFLLCGLRFAPFPAKDFFGVPSFSYLRHSMVFWVLCAPPCCLYSMQCFPSTWCFFGIRLLKVTIFFLEEPPPFILAWVPSHPMSVGKAFLMHSSTLSNLWTLWGTKAPVSLYWSYQSLGTICSMWFDKSTSSDGFMTLVNLVIWLE